MTEFFSHIFNGIGVVLFSLSTLFGFQPPIINQSPVVGSTQGAADYSSSLTNSITAVATTLTVVSTSTPSGEYLTIGKRYGLKLGGREYVLGTLSGGRQFTSLTRGVSLITGTTTGGVAEQWGRGTSVEITDAPLLLDISNKVSGTGNFDALLSYDSGVDCTVSTPNDKICDKAYVDGVAILGASNANETTNGISELATNAEAGGGVSLGSTGARLVLPASIASSSPTLNTAIVVVASSTLGGRISPDFIATTSPAGQGKPVQYTWEVQHTWNGTTTPDTATSTFNVPLDIEASATEPVKLNGATLSFPATQPSTTTVFAVGEGGAVNFYHPATMIGYWASSTYQAASATGDQIFTHALGRKPQIIEVHAITQSSGSSAGATTASYGVATSTGNNQSASSMAVQDTTGSESCGNTSTGNIIYLLDSNTCATVRAAASITAISATSVTLNWGTNGSGAKRMFTIILR